MTALLACIDSLSKLADDLFVEEPWRDRARILLAEAEAAAGDALCGSDEARVAEVLFEPEGGGGHPAAGGEAGTSVTGPLGGGAYGTGRRDEDDPNLVSHALSVPTSNARYDPDGETFVTNLRGREEGARAELDDKGMSVRRLTPVECERLQGFPDGWTCLCQPLNAYAADPEAAAERCACPDSPRYKQMGNAVTVTVVEWRGRRLVEIINERL